MSDYAYLKICAVWVLVLSALFCQKEPVDPILGAWSKAYPNEQEKGYSFYEDGSMFRYTDKCAPLDSLDKHYTYRHIEDSVFISWPAGGYAVWRIEWISRDFLRVHEWQAEQTYPETFYLERDLWGQ